MIPLKQLRENKAAIVAGLQKRNFKQTELIDSLLSLDEKRRKTQTELDQQLAEANQLAKEIGQLFKSGKADEAQERKARSGELKSSTKVLQEDLQTTKGVILAHDALCHRVVERSREAPEIGVPCAAHASRSSRIQPPKRLREL